MTITKSSTLLALSGMALLMAPAASLPAFAANDPAPAASGSSAAIVPPSVLVFDQKADGATVTIKYAHLPRAGYLAIYNADASGKPAGEPMGHVALTAGDHRDIKVTLSKAPAASAKLTASLYEDKDGDSKLDRSKDLSFWANGTLPSTARFSVQ